MTYRLATFSSDITPPIGSPLACDLPAVKSIDDPQSALGLVLLGAGDPIVLVVLDWCQLYNDGYDPWLAALAAAAGTSPQRVLVSTVHQHDAPLVDYHAQHLAQRHGLGDVCDIAAVEQALARTAAALKAALPDARPVTHVGIGQARVDQVASNRRILGPDGKVAIVRWSASKDPAARDAPEGLIDPFLKAITFFDDDRPVATVNHYTTHPMSHYGKGAVSADFCGLARARRQKDDPDCFQMFANGCAGNITAGKYNDGEPRTRSVLTERVYCGMVEAAAATVRHPLDDVDFKQVSLALPVRNEPGFTVEDLTRDLSDPQAERFRAAAGLSYRHRTNSGHRIALSAVKIGPADIVHLPGEPFIEFQLAAQQFRPDRFVMAVAYGEGGPGYICTDAAYQQGGYEPSRWCFTAVGSEPAMLSAIESVLSD
jgi:hypothetical protein